MITTVIKFRLFFTHDVILTVPVMGDGTINFHVTVHGVDITGWRTPNKRYCAEVNGVPGMYSDIGFGQAVALACSAYEGMVRAAVEKKSSDYDRVRKAAIAARAEWKRAQEDLADAEDTLKRLKSSPATFLDIVPKQKAG